MTLRQFAAEPSTLPTRTAWYLAELGEARGKQELFTRQSPQRLKVLREHVLIESAISSNRIEGVEVDQSRVGTLIFGRPALRDRDEEEQSSKHWHEGRHDPWPAMNFLLFILTEACREFERRVGQLKSSRGEKTAMVLAAVDRQAATFRIADVQAECPGVGVDLVRLVLDRLRKEGEVKCLGTGRSARWAKTGN